MSHAVCQMPYGAAHPGCMQSMQVVLDAIDVPDVRLGIYASERTCGQRIRLTLTLGLDLSGVRQRDHIDETADYAMLIDGVITLCQSKHFDLLETLVLALTQWVLGVSSRIVAAQVTVYKLEAPVAALVSASYVLCRGQSAA